MVTIIQYEDSHFKFSNFRGVDESNIETAPTPTTHKNKVPKIFKDSFCEPDNFDMQQQDYYISKSFFKSTL